MYVNPKVRSKNEFTKSPYWDISHELHRSHGDMYNGAWPVVFGAPPSYDTEERLQQLILDDKIGWAKYERRVGELVRDHPERLIQKSRAQHKAFPFLRLVLIYTGIVFILLNSLHENRPYLYVIGVALIGLPAYLSPESGDRTRFRG